MTQQEGGMTWPPAKVTLSTLLMCPWARHKLPSCTQQLGFRRDGGRPLTSLWRGEDKKRFSQWGLIKYHIIIWMQLIVSSSVYISACRPFWRNAWYDLVSLYLLEKVCAAKCHMIKKQSAVLYTSHFSIHFSVFKLQFITSLLLFLFLSTHSSHTSSG